MIEIPIEVLSVLCFLIGLLFGALLAIIFGNICKTF